MTKKYECAQIGETAFGKRKYERGARRRKGGVQWGLTKVKVDKLTRKMLAVKLQMLPYNKRDEETLTLLIVQRMKSGGQITTDEGLGGGLIEGDWTIDKDNFSYQDDESDEDFVI